MNVRYRVVNRSRRRTGRAVLTARLVAAAGPRLLLAGRKRIPALRARRTYSGKSRMIAPASLPPGSYRLVACVKRAGVRAVCRSAARRTRVPAPGDSPPLPPAPGPGPATPPAPPAAAPDPKLIAAGDIAGCDTPGDSETAALLDALGPDLVAPLGDLVYEDGTLEQFEDCYGPNWGRYKAITRPAVGNHEYYTAGASGYFTYFGAAAGNPAKGYYSYDVGRWHVIALNSNCEEVACDAASPQADWLRADLAAHPNTCTLAYWHHPRFNSSTRTGGRAAVSPLWDILDDGGADVVLTSHAHTYERFAAQTSDGTADAGGLRQFIVGTGGRDHHDVDTVAPNSEVRNSGTFGVLEMTLKPAGYDWRFVPVAGESFTDSGTDSCA